MEWLAKHHDCARLLPPIYRDVVEQWRSFEGATAYMCEDGFMLYQNAGDEGLVHLIFVDPQHRRCGLASSLLSRLPHNNVIAAVESLECAALWEKHGFVIKRGYRGSWLAQRGTSDCVFVEG
jgi:GNAT superfamily N-acetyltransferase